jgi:hypothetical protein
MTESYDSIERASVPMSLTPLSTRSCAASSISDVGMSALRDLSRMRVWRRQTSRIASKS